MEFKIDTKEKFNQFQILAPELTANMTVVLRENLTKLLQTGIKNVILDLGSVKRLSQEAAEAIVQVQQFFYEHNASFVVYGIACEVEQYLEKEGLLEMMNVTPTESEAMDIVHMEEIERELLNDDGE